MSLSETNKALIRGMITEATESLTKFKENIEKNFAEIRKDRQSFKAAQGVGWDGWKENGFKSETTGLIINPEEAE